MAKLDICNKALALITSKRIVSLDAIGREEQVLNLFYDDTRKELLTLHPFNFSLMTRQFTHLTEVDTQDWGYVYQYPSTCLIVRSVATTAKTNFVSDIYTTDIEVSAESGKNYRVSMNSYDNKKYIYSDIQDPYITYTYDLTDTSLFDPLFESALVYLLAHRISFPLTGKKNIADDMYMFYNMAVLKATASNAGEGNELVLNFDKYINAR